MCDVAPDVMKDKITPPPGWWPLKKVQKWLDENPIDDDCNREYLLNGIDEILEKAKADDAQKAEEQALFNKRWVGL